MIFSTLIKNTGKDSCFLILKTKIQIEFKYRNQGWNNFDPFQCFENKNVLPFIFHLKNLIDFIKKEIEI